MITGQDAAGRPEARGCATCHNGTIVADQITPWKNTGHAEILSNNLNENSHYGPQCFACHSVGFDPTVDNNGFDDELDYQDFLASGLISHPGPDNWTTMLAQFPRTAQFANVQCDSCHGPGQTPLHTNGELDKERISLSADVCATCHGEPKRHARYQQWEESGHSDFDLAISRGASSASCARCHSAQGFLAWLPQLEAGNPGDLEEPITWTADETQPVTCSVCHDPHDTGLTSGNQNTAAVRISGHTPLLPGGYKASGVGMGALCITCHNTRNGLHNDNVAGLVDDRAPHTSGQGDVLMGQNAYFVKVGLRGAHSYVENTCTTCHMELTPPPPELSYELVGTNHTFRASRDVCSSCHGEFKGGNLEVSINILEHDLELAIADAILAEIGSQIAAGNTVTLLSVGANGADVNLTSIEGATATISESRGHQAVNIKIGDTTYSNVQLTGDTAVSNPGGTVIGSLTDSEAGQLIVKAGWNYWLLHADGSGGIHNPSFVLEVLTASMQALQ